MGLFGAVAEYAQDTLCIVRSPQPWSRRMRLWLRLNALAPPVQEYVLAGAIEMGHARALLALPIEAQSGAAARIVNGALSVRETERLVHGLLNPARRAARRKGKPAYDADTARLENDLAEKLGAVVHIEPGRQGAGRIVIRYSTLEQLDGIVERLGFAKA